MLLGTLGASLLRDILSKGFSGKGVIRAGEGTIRASYGSKRPPLKTLKYKNIIKMNQDLMEILVEIIYLI